MKVHIALNNQTPETGGLHFIPGSHRCSDSLIVLLLWALSYMSLHAGGHVMVCLYQSLMRHLVTWSLSSEYWQRRRRKGSNLCYKDSGRDTQVSTILSWCMDHMPTSEWFYAWLSWLQLKLVYGKTLSFTDILTSCICISGIFCHKCVVMVIVLM